MQGECDVGRKERGKDKVKKGKRIAVQSIVDVVNDI